LSDLISVGVITLSYFPEVILYTSSPLSYPILLVYDALLLICMLSHGEDN